MLSADACAVICSLGSLTLNLVFAGARAVALHHATKLPPLQPIVA